MQTRNSGRQASSVPTVGDAETTNVGTAASDGPRQSKRRRLSGAAVEYKIQKEKTPRKSSQGYLTMEAAAAKHGYASKSTRQDVRRKLKQQEDRRAKLLDSIAVESLNALADGLESSISGSEHGRIEASQGNSQSISRGRLGNSGRPRLSEGERRARQDSRFTLHGFKDFKAYAEQVKNCAEIVSCAPLGSKFDTANEQIATKLTFNGKPLMNARYLCNLARDEELTEIRRRGGVLLTCDEERYMANEIRKARRHYLAVRPSHVKELATNILRKDPERAALIGEHGVTHGWFQRFCIRNGIRTGKPCGLEVLRARWVTAENAVKHYEVLKDALVSTGVAVVNEEYDRTTQGSSELIFVHPGRLVSLDETNISLNEEPTGENGQRICLAGPGDQGNIMMSKGVLCGSLMFVRMGDSRMLSPLVVYNGTGEVPADWRDEGVRGDAVDDNGEIITALWARNEKASVTSTLLMEYAKEKLLPAFFANGVQPGVPGAGGVLVFDGCSSHIAKDFLTFMKENNVTVVLRPPNTSSVMQGEDTTIFRYLKF